MCDWPCVPIYDKKRDDEKKECISVRKELTAISLFSGCGGFDWGAQQAGAKIIWANDIDTSAAHAYQNTFPNVDFHESDIIRLQKFPNADVLIGCYPCTGFSLGSRRRSSGAIEPRDLQEVKGNFLYKEFLRVLKQVQPRYLFVENVRGMLSADDGWFFQDQIRSFKELGYKITFAQMDASRYGVAQNRERVFIVGVRRDIKFKYQFVKPTHADFYLRERARNIARTLELQVEGKKASACRKRVYKGSCKWTGLALRSFEEELEQGVIGSEPQTLEKAIMGKTWSDDDYCDTSFHGHYLTRNRKRSWKEPSFTIVAHAHHVPLHPGGSPMVSVGVDEWALQGEFNRRLSWRECAAIQGLPETTIPSGSLDRKYKVIGNAVPPAFGKMLLTPIVEYENSL